MSLADFSQHCRWRQEVFCGAYRTQAMHLCSRYKLVETLQISRPQLGHLAKFLLIDAEPEAYRLGLNSSPLLLETQVVYLSSNRVKLPKSHNASF